MSASADAWAATPVKLYGYGPGFAHPSVKHVECPVCHQPPGALCIGTCGPHLGRHYRRADLYRVKLGKMNPLQRSRLLQMLCGFRGCTRLSDVTIHGDRYRRAEVFCCSTCAANFPITG